MSDEPETRGVRRRRGPATTERARAAKFIRNAGKTCAAAGWGRRRPAALRAARGDAQSPIARTAPNSKKGIFSYLHLYLEC